MNSSCISYHIVQCTRGSNNVEPARHLHAAQCAWRPWQSGCPIPCLAAAAPAEPGAETARSGWSCTLHPRPAHCPRHAVYATLMYRPCCGRSPATAALCSILHQLPGWCWLLHMSAGCNQTRCGDKQQVFELQQGNVLQRSPPRAHAVNCCDLSMHGCAAFLALVARLHCSAASQLHHKAGCITRQVAGLVLLTTARDDRDRV
jgi:hypothetical protein